jgi:starch phosphorylase
VLDGWWDEWFDGENGWAIPSADVVLDPQRRDSVEAAALYDLLSLSVAPTFYDVGADGLPQRWLEMITHTLRTLGPKVQATRMVRQYATEVYHAASASSRALLAGGDGSEGAGAGSGAGSGAGTRDQFAGAASFAAWKQRVTQAWPGVRIELVEIDDGDHGPGARLTVRAGVALGELSPDDVTVQVVYGRAEDDDEIANPVFGELALEEPPGPDSVAWYCGIAVLGQPGVFGYTVRVLPTHPLLASPAEMALVATPVAPAGMVTGDLR